MRRETFNRLGIILICILIFVIYGLFKAGSFLTGPKVVIETPQNGRIFSSSDVEVRGWAKNVSLLYLNGRQIFTDQKGNFKETVLLARGYNIVELKAKDKFGREIRELRELVLK